MRTVARLIYHVNRMRWRLTRPLTVGVRLLAIKQDTVLLVKHTYQDAWYLPGGGVQKGESLEAAIRREVSEEAGAALGDLHLFGVYSNFYEHKSDHIIVFRCTEFALTAVKNFEIAQVALFDFEELPPGTSPGTRRRVQEHIHKREPVIAQW